MLFFVSGQAIAQNNPITSITISLPANPDASLANGAVLSEANVMDAINFRWTPVIPKPRESEHRLVLKTHIEFHRRTFWHP